MSDDKTHPKILRKIYKIFLTEEKDFENIGIKTKKLKNKNKNKERGIRSLK